MEQTDFVKNKFEITDFLKNRLNQIHFNVSGELTTLKMCILNQQWKDIQNMKKRYAMLVDYVYININKIRTAIYMHHDLDQKLFTPEEFNILQEELKAQKIIENDIRQLSGIVSKLINKYPVYFNETETKK